MRQVAHETPVHLEVVDRKELEVAERRIAGAEVVDGEVHAHRAQIAHELHRLVRIPHHHAFGDFELEDAGFGPGGLEDFRELGYELLLAELDGRKVDRDRHPRQAGILPGLGARADLAQRPQSDRNDQTRFLGEVDEFLREQQAPLGVLPAQQRFDPRDRACGHVDLGLVVHAELAPLQAVPQAGLQGELLRRVRLQLGGVEAESVAAPVLGAVHGDVRSRQQRLRVAAVGRIGADPDAQRDVELLPVDLAQLGHGCEQLSRDLGQRGRVAQLFDQQHEFVSAEARDDVALAHAVCQALGGFLQHPVAELVAERVVDVLETVQVHEEERHRPRVTLRPGERALELLVEQYPVGQAREMVVRGDLTHVAESRAELLVARAQALAKTADSAADDREEGQHGGEPRPLEPFVIDVHRLRFEIHEQIDHRRVAGEDLQGGLDEFAGGEVKHAESQHDQAQVEHDGAPLVEAVDGVHHHDVADEDLRPSQVRVGEFPIQAGTKHRVEPEVHHDHHRDEDPRGLPRDQVEFTGEPNQGNAGRIGGRGEHEAAQPLRLLGIPSRHGQVLDHGRFIESYAWPDLSGAKLVPARILGEPSSCPRRKRPRRLRRVARISRVPASEKGHGLPDVARPALLKGSRDSNVPGGRTGKRV